MYENKKSAPNPASGAPFLIRIGSLNGRDVYRCRSLRSLLDVKGNPVTFLQSFEPRPIDAGVMDENIRTILLFDKTITLAFIEPFYYTIGHCGTLLQ
jgi:hypothetical protein